MKTKFSDLWKLVSQKCNNFLLPGSSRHACCKFFIDDFFVGLIPPNVTPLLLDYPNVFVWSIQSDSDERCITLHSSLSTFEARTKAVAQVLVDLRSKRIFKALDGWRDEDYGIYIDNRQQSLLRLERSATSLLGVVRYGVHVNGYFIKHESTLHDTNAHRSSCTSNLRLGSNLYNEPLNGRDPSTMMMWLGVRSINRPTWPGMLDNVAAGGLTYGLNALACARKECQEEASVPEGLLNALIAVGQLSYVFENDCGICHQVAYCFDLELPADFVPVSADGEMDGFQLVSIAEVKELIFSDQFKANSALVVLDFLYRHNFIDASSDPQHSELQSLMHTKFEFD